jgi:O-antigen/teichoic acid export membrane protein
MQSLSALILSKARRFLQYLPSQGITTAGNLLYGFLCVRILPKADYAKFTVVFGFLGTLGLLSDVSFSGSILPLIGDRIDNLPLIADYIASLRQLTHRIYFILVPFVIIVFPIVVRNQSWDWTIVTSMIAILLGTAWFIRISGAYGSVLIVRRDRQRWYWAQKASSLGTLALLLIFWMAHWLSAFAAILINVSGIVFISQVVYFRARHLLGTKGHASREKRAAIIHMAAPGVPGAIFYSLQGQISVLLITIFGHTEGVANIGALGRLAQIYVVFVQLNPLLLEPYFAKISKSQFKTSYFAVVAGAIALGLTITGSAALFPKVFLAVLGPKYGDLNFELLLVIATASVSYLTGVLYIVHTARRFIYWWSGGLTIVLVLTAQVIYIWKESLNTVSSVLILGLITTSTTLLVVILTGICGFIYGPREIKGSEQESGNV